MDFEKIKEAMVKEHQFMGKTITYNMLKNMETVHTYIDNSHHTRSVKKDSDGTLYLYEFDEHVTFGPRGDIMNETFTLVKSMADATILNQQRHIRRIPFMHIDNEWNFHIYDK